MAHPLKVLIVEDESVVAMELEDRLTLMGYDVVGACASGSAAFERIAVKRPDIVLMDIHLQGEKDGIAVAMEIAARFDIPVVYLTAHSDVATLQRAKTANSYGYLLKPFRVEELKTTLEMAMYRHQSDVQLRRQTIIDPLTGAYNRRFLDEVIPREFYQAQRTGAPLSVAMLDIDRFKKVNDDHGHAAGDQVLKAVAVELLGSLRRSDLVFRYGGEEFAVILPDTPLGGAVSKLERICDQIRAMAIPCSDSEAELKVTLSVGVAAIADYARSAAELMGAADDALYRAKQSGRDRVCAARKTE